MSIQKRDDQVCVARPSHFHGKEVKFRKSKRFTLSYMVSDFKRGGIGLQCHDSDHWVFLSVFVGSDTVSTTYLLCDLEQVPKPLWGSLSLSVKWDLVAISQGVGRHRWAGALGDICRVNSLTYNIQDTGHPKCGATIFFFFWSYCF